MKDIFIKYYFPVFGIRLMMIVPLAVLNSNTDELFETILSISLFLIFLTVLIGALNYKFGDILQDKRKKNALKKELFQKFISSGFDNNEISVFGYYQNYYIILSKEEDSFEHRKWIEMVILFNPKQQNQYIPGYLFEKLYKLKKSNYSWNSNCLTIEKYFGIKYPKYETVLNEIEQALQILKAYKIEPITNKEWDLTIEESLKHYNQTSRLKTG